jgi:allantoinase
VSNNQLGCVPKLTLPPLISSAHVHLNEPGRTDWEGFQTGTQAAASGGVTTVIDMPLNSIPPTTTADNLEKKRDAAVGKCHTDVGFWGGVIPGNQVSINGTVSTAKHKLTVLPESPRSFG